MPDLPESDHTQCDRCALTVHWTKTKRWRVMGDKCYCEECAATRGAIKNTQVNQLPKYFRTDLDYHGEYFHD